MKKQSTDKDFKYMYECKECGMTYSSDHENDAGKCHACIFLKRPVINFRKRKPRKIQIIDGVTS